MSFNSYISHKTDNLKVNFSARKYTFVILFKLGVDHHAACAVRSCLGTPSRDTFLFFPPAVIKFGLVQTPNADVAPPAAVGISSSAFGLTTHRSNALGQELCHTCAKGNRCS